MKPIFTKRLNEFASVIEVYRCSRKSLLSIVKPIMEPDVYDLFVKEIQEASGYSVVEDDKRIIIWLDVELTDPLLVINVLVHEAHHASSHINKYHSLDSEEFCAYLEAEIVCSVFSKLRSKLD